MLMASSTYTICLLLFLLNACLILSTTESYPEVMHPGKDLIIATCKRTANFSLCIRTLQSDSRSFKSDVKGLAQISLEVALTKANQTLYLCGDLFKNTRDPMLSRLYGTCIEDFRQAAENNLPGALRDLKSNKFGDSKFGADEAVRHADIVIEAFAGRTSQVLSGSQRARDLCSIASSIVSALQ